MKLSFEQLSLEVQKLYHQTVDESQFDFQSQVVSSLITSAGWTEEQYWESWMSLDEGLTS